MKDSVPDKDKRKKVFFIKGICIVMLLVMSLIFLVTHTIESIKSTGNYTINTMKEERFDSIYIYLLELQEEARLNADTISKDIETYIHSCGDLNDIKKEMENGDFNEIIHTIFSSQNTHLNGIDNYRNGIIIAAANGIVEDSNYDRVQGKQSRDWESEIENSYNKTLEKYAINLLLNQSDSVIITESVNLLTEDDTNYKTHRKIKSSDYETLLDVYKTEGIQGLKNYQVWVPAYITDTGDIFGQDDIVNGIRVENHKLIVIQEFNLYDQIKLNHPELMDDDDIKTVNDKFNNNLSHLYIIGLCYAVVVLIIMIYFSNQYNSYIEKHNLY